MKAKTINFLKESVKIISVKYNTEKILQEPLIKLIEFPNLRQEYNYDCGALALLEVLVYYGFEEREEYILKDLTKDSDDVIKNGVYIRAIKDYAEKRKLKCDIIKGLEPRQLIPYLDKNIPIIVLLQAWKDGDNPNPWETDYKDGHYVTAIGYTKDCIIFEDPASFERTYLSFNEMKKRWHAISDDNKDDPETVSIIIKGVPRFKANKIVHLD